MLFIQAKAGALLAADDKDLLIGRFASRPETSTTGSACSGRSEFEYFQSCATISRVLEPGLGAKITKENDQELFIQCLVADGMESWVQEL